MGRGDVRPVATYSIVACDLAARQWGVAVQSKFLAVGAVVPWAAAGVGAVATQSYANPRYGPAGLALLEQGRSAEQAIAELVAADVDRDHRQVGMVDANGEGATYTGGACQEWAGGETGPGFAAQGNILVSEATVAALADAFRESAGEPLARRLLGCLRAAQRAGGDRRGQQSAALLVVQREGGYAGLSDRLIDLRVDDHPDPIVELERIYRLHDKIFGQTPREQWVPVGADLRHELTARLASLGYEGNLEDAIFAWAGRENLEERYSGLEALDPVLLAELRSQSKAPVTAGKEGGMVNGPAA